MLGSTFVQNPILRINWAGWESDTLTLSRTGWKIQMCQEVHLRAMRLMIEHEKGVQAFSGIVRDFDFHRFTPETMSNYRVNVGLTHMAENINIQVCGTPEMMDFRAVDTVPSYVDEEILSLNEFKVFRESDAIITDAQGIAFDEEDIDEVLATIRKMQKPRQRELLKAAEAGEITLEQRKYRANIIGITG